MTILPGVISVLERYLREYYDGRYNSLIEYLPHFPKKPAGGEEDFRDLSSMKDDLDWIIAFEEREIHYQSPPPDDDPYSGIVTRAGNLPVLFSAPHACQHRTRGPLETGR